MARKVDDDLYLAEGDEVFEDYGETEVLEEKRPKVQKKAPRDDEKEGEDVGEESYRESGGDEEESY